MALIICPECRRQISSKAPACPGCGCPTSSQASPASPQPTQPPTPRPSRPAAPRPAGGGRVSGQGHVVTNQTTQVVNKSGMGCFGCFIWVLIIFVGVPAILVLLKVKFLLDFVERLTGG